MKNIKLFIFIICFYPITCTYGQKGHVYLHNIDINEVLVDPVIRCIAFDNNSYAFIGSRKGVTIFDGKIWKSVESIPKNVFSLQYDSINHIMYTGLKNEFGYINRSSTGLFIYHSLKKLQDTDIEFTQIQATQNKVVFYSEKAVFIIDKHDSTKLQSVYSKKYGNFLGLVMRKDNIYINIEDKGLHKIANNRCNPVKMGKDLKNSKILFCSNFNNKNELIGTNQNKIYLFNGRGFIQFVKHTGIRDFLQENILWNGLDISGKYFAVTTLTGGCAIIDKKYGKIVDVINYHTGLKDDEIFTIALDNNNALWLAHEHGISYCNINIPLRNYSSYPGLSGNINDVFFDKNKLYVATNDGVYFLSEVKTRTEREILATKTSSKKRSISTKDEKNKNSLHTEKVPQYVKRNEYSLTHQFKPVTNLSEKCKKLYQLDENLLVTTNYGLYEIYDSIAYAAITNLYINNLCLDKDTTALYIASIDGVYLVSYYYDEEEMINRWKKQKIFHKITFPVYSIVQDSIGDLLLGGDGKVFLSRKDSLLSYSSPEQLNLPGELNEPVNLKKIDNSIYLIQSIGILNYNVYKKSIYYKDILSVWIHDRQYVLGRNNAWVKDSLKWSPVIEMAAFNNADYLSLFSKIRYIHTDKKKDLWIINGSDQLIKLLSKPKMEKEDKFTIDIFAVSDNTDSLYLLNNAVFSYRNNAVKITLSTPVFLRPDEIRFQYFVEGLKNYEKWSNWLENNTIELSSVPPGNYTMYLRAKNIFSQLSEVKQFNFTILLPFWKKKPFYITLGILFLLLVAFVFYLSHRRLLKKKRILEQKVRERTIELQAEKDKVSGLLKNILPVATINELKKNNKVTPRNYESVTVLFTDFKGFTKIAEKLTPEELVNEIDYCFKAFDNIIGNYKIEKIKTIGDSYMCAGGIPTKYKDNAIEVLKAALDIRDFMEQYKAERINQNKPYFEIRIGIHTGQVVAGIVGTKKYAYDIWGDTVNVASRMESSGESGKVNISGDTYKLVKDKFDCLSRGKVTAKNKGEVDMYFVNGEKISGPKKKTDKA